MSDTYDVVIIGAGLSGISAAYYLTKNCPDKKFVILESRDAIGGTWDLFQYPGIRSDSSMFTFGYEFEPWIDNKYLADGPSIKSYIRSVADRYRFTDTVRYGQSVQTATWDSKECSWSLQILNKDGKFSTINGKFLFMCTGYYDYKSGYTPDFPGKENFRGTIVHPQSWPADLDYAGKKVVVIGSGATAVTLIPNMADKAGHVTMLQRSPSYISAIPMENPMVKFMYRVLPTRIAYGIARWYGICENLVLYAIAKTFPKTVKKLVLGEIRKALGPDYDVEKHFSPNYDPWDQRYCVCPDGDIFKAIKSKKASVVTDHIECFDESGIKLKSGEHLPADIIVTATGLNALPLAGIKFIVGGNTVDLRQSVVYRGCLLSQLPNLAWSMGYVNNSFTLKVDLTWQYMTRVLNYMQAKKLHGIMPVPDGPLETAPLLNLTSGYVERAKSIFPTQGLRAPWRYHSYYFQDLWRMSWTYSLTDKELKYWTAD